MGRNNLKVNTHSCFEVNDCPGLYWEGRNACSGVTVANAIAALAEEPEIETRMAGIEDNSVRLTQLRRGGRRSPVLRQSEKTRRRLETGGRLHSRQLVRPVLQRNSNKHYLTISTLDF